MKKAAFLFLAFSVSFCSYAQESNSKRAQYVFEHVQTAFSMEDITIEYTVKTAPAAIYNANPLELSIFLMFSTGKENVNDPTLLSMAYNALLLASVTMGREPLSWNDFNFWMLTYLPDAEGEVWKAMVFFSRDVLSDGEIDYIYNFRQ